MLVIGITGGVASGKSTVCKMLSDMDVVVADVDKVAHGEYKKGTACHAQIIECFGDVVVTADGEIDRRKLGGIVFSDKSKMTQLTDIVWPAVRQALIQYLATAEESSVREGRPTPIIAMEAAIMIEAGWQDLVSVLWVIEVDRVQAKDKLMARDKLSEEEAFKRIDSQISNEERRKHATYVIKNDISKEELLLETRRLYDLTLASATNV